MVIFNGYIKTAATFITVEGSALANAANTAAVAVENTLLLVLVIVEGADVAEVLRKVLVETYLDLLAAQALDVGHCMPVQLMVLLWVHLVLE